MDVFIQTRVCSYLRRTLSSKGPIPMRVIGKWPSGLTHLVATLPVLLEVQFAPDLFFLFHGKEYLTIIPGHMGLRVRGLLNPLVDQDLSSWNLPFGDDLSNFPMEFHLQMPFKWAMTSPWHRGLPPTSVFPDSVRSRSKRLPLGVRHNRLDVSRLQCFLFWWNSSPYLWIIYGWYMENLWILCVKMFFFWFRESVGSF